MSTRPKLLPPLALLWQGPWPQQAGEAGRAPANLPSPLTRSELRNIVADLIG